MHHHNRALPDAWITAHILLAAPMAASPADLNQWTTEPSCPTRITFGKHRVTRFAGLPRYYLDWIVKQDLDASVLTAARRELAT